MEVFTSRSVLQTHHHVLTCSFRSPSRVKCDMKNYAVREREQSSCHTLIQRAMQRRLFLGFVGFNPLISLLQPAFSAAMPEMKEPEIIRTLKLPSGVRIQEIIEGEGPKVRDGNVVQINYVCRRSNGYFVHSTVDQFSGESSPVVLPLDENQIIKGLKDVLIGMRVGGKRRALIPPSVGYVNENLKPIPEEFGPRRSLLSHASEPLIFEVQLLKLL